MVNTRLVFFEPTSKHKCNKIVDPSILPYITFIKPNLDEIQALAHAIDPKSNTQHPNECIETLLKAGVQNILLTMGSQGIKFGHYQGTKIAISDFDAPITKQIKNVCTHLTLFIIKTHWGLGQWGW